MDPIPLPADFVRATLAALDLPPHLAQRYTVLRPAQPSAPHHDRRPTGLVPQTPARAAGPAVWPFPGP
ncbi:MAG: hypothetical protein M5U08_26150 [Burkholderiales bacterium]|nr:hypothetical protein [Burkholderiales bacterium]